VAHTQKALADSVGFFLLNFSIVIESWDLFLSVLDFRLDSRLDERSRSLPRRSSYNCLPQQIMQHKLFSGYQSPTCVAHSEPLLELDFDDNDKVWMMMQGTMMPKLISLTVS